MNSNFHRNLVFDTIDHISRLTVLEQVADAFVGAAEPYDWKVSRGHQRFMQALETFGMGKGLVVPVGRSANVPACVWLAGKDPDLDEDANRATEVIALFAASKAYVLSRPSDIGARTSKLTLREREVLTWAAQGKSAWEIGEILNIAKRTVDAHTQNATRKLGAITRIQAVVEAIQIGEIEL